MPHKRPDRLVLWTALAVVLFAAPASAQCIYGTQFGSASFGSCNQEFITATTCAFAGEYSTFNNLVAGFDYEFRGTGGFGNFLTITDTSNNALAWGFPPLVWTSTLNGTVRVHVATNAQCGTEFQCHMVQGRCLGVTSEYVLDTGDPNERICNPKSYTDLGNGIVRDDTTGLEWMQEGSSGTYAWDNASSYIQELNDNNTLGYDDWRLPGIEELSTLADAGRYNPAIDPVFSDTAASPYWSSTAASYDAGSAWCVNFYNGLVDDGGKANTYFVRAVRGGQHGTFVNFVGNNDGTVTDTVTDLMWQQCSYGRSWDGDNCTGIAGTRTWQQALDYVQELNDNNTLGYNDWRLPTRNELQSLVDYSLNNPATTIPDTVPGFYFSSTTAAENTAIAWIVSFYTGYVSYGSKSVGYNVRAVRGGPCRSQGDWCLDASDCDDDLFCTGTETCADSVCGPGGGDPCTGDPGQPYCDEAGDTCAECLADGDCPDDGLFCTGDPLCDEGWCDFTGNPCGNGTPVCVEDNDTCVQCVADGDCAATEWCRQNVCVPRCELIVTYKPILAPKLTKARKVVLNITSEDEGFNVFGRIDLGPFTWKNVKFNGRKGRLKITAIVPAGLEPGSYPISVGDCSGEVVITGTDR